MSIPRIGDLLESAARRHPNAEAVRDGSRSFTYGEAREAARGFAEGLAARGVEAGDRVAVLAANSWGFFTAYFGAALRGAILVPLNVRLSATEMRAVLADAGPRLLLYDEDHAARAKELGDAGPEAAGLEELAAPKPASAGAAFAPAPGDPDDVAHIYYTSGTTGRPKGVMLTHRNVVTHALAAIEELGLQGGDRWAHIAPMFHLADAWATFALTHAGGVHVMLRRFTAPAALDLLARERLTITNLVPTMLNLMVAEPDAAEREYSLRLMLSGGAPIAPEVVRAVMRTFGCDYAQTYGMTETSPYLTLSLLYDHLRELPREEQILFKCKTGRPFSGVDLKVVREDGGPVPPDGRTVGEIRVRGPTVTPGYWRQPEATAQAFDEAGFLCTGDLATLDGEGYVQIVDRKKDVILTGGEVVYSIEVENALYRHPAVLEAAVFGTPEPTWGEVVTAAVVPRPGQEVGAEELQAFCRQSLAGFKVPRRFEFRSELPKTGSGKIQKRVLRTG